jgi:tetraacyldisaccharide 4'-kinase
MTPFRLLLLPVCFFYGIITWFRNKFFDWGLLRSKKYPFPLISVGNLSTGGTGKTPHVEYLVKHFKNQYKIAVLSRGYKRKTSGFFIVNKKHQAGDVGDEPLQISKKFPDVLVAVSESRRKGIKRIIKAQPETNLVILDDAFQHRYVKPSMNIAITEYFKPFFDNYILPCGNLREYKSGIKRANAVIVSKTPSVFSPLDRNYFINKMAKFELDNIFFSTINYGSWVPVTSACPEPKSKYKTLFLFSGIANISAFEEHLKRHCEELIIKRFPDHYQFKKSDLKELRKAFFDTFGGSKAIVITEKDAMRLQTASLINELKNLPIYFIPIEVAFHNKYNKNFNDFIIKHLSQF